MTTLQIDRIRQLADIIQAQPQRAVSICATGRTLAEHQHASPNGFGF